MSTERLEKNEKFDASVSLNALARCARDHAVFHNPFYDLWKSRRLTYQQFNVFRKNYEYRIAATVGRISRALVTIDNIDARLCLWENLGDELGHGNPDRVHIRIFNIWASQLAKRLAAAAADDATEVSILPATRRFVDVTNEMCESDSLSAVGAILAQEWHGYSQIAFLYDGYLLYRDLFAGEEFHDFAEYFYVHIGRAEKEHQVQALAIAKLICSSREDFLSVERAFFIYLDLLDSFWAEIHGAICSMQ